MNLSELKSLLSDHSARLFRISLPDGNPVPLSFHVTEVGRVWKTFLDCGGTLRESVTCQLQVWVGQDYDHRIETGKMAAILEKAKAYLPDEGIPVEIEYEDRVISQYTITDHELSDDAVILKLAHKHTECLAPELCGLPPLDRLPAIGGKSSCCGPAGCC
ncbi:hypothetical protein JIN84_20680 [Luteolibacter yonseiensis]|uniref:Uncharacterized protein n=1 Tax=Luteolibacter yonseiensis TaxID=1144680 RepID=A0A934R6C0_9BACT|nr:DUF6428 family protein [Luteolibacter yonseiensis]MBK1818051.1 hypothetical protein [Luteolibacter yonseiensis]